MSWSFGAMGTPGEVVNAVNAKSEQISRAPDDPARKEYDEAKVHLLSLIEQKFPDGVGDWNGRQAIRVAAEGSDSREHGVTAYTRINVTIERINVASE